tara:strand:- start:50592 stop:51272 length:681 start_codon:yes stop_codon:yes gene_type:complete
MQIKHIFFDLDHTLWDFETNSAKTFEFIFKEHNIHVNLDSFLYKYIPVNHKYWKLYREEKVSKISLRYNRLKETFDALNYAISDAEINNLAQVYIDNLSNFNTLFEGTIEVLDYLLPKYEMHIITNGFDEVQRLKLENSKILKYFDKIITSESVGVKKPNPKIFEYALQSANTTAAQSIMIGDNYEADIQGALNMNMQAIFCNFDKQSIGENILSIHNLSELKRYL